jgi:tyrosine-protein phosphatase SIW14
MPVKLICLILFIAAPAFASAQISLPRFSKVTDTIYRGSRPDEAAIAGLQKMGIKTIVDLEDDKIAVADEILLANRYGIKVISTPMSGFWAPDDAQVQTTLDIIDSSANQPLYVHCQHGEDRTGLIVGLYRVFYQKWTPKAAWIEMKLNGFHRILFLLADYFEDATGFEI